MANSMTGYGAGDDSLSGIPLSLEARSVNHRYLETTVRGPRWTLPLEPDIRAAVKKRFARGRFDIFIHYGDTSNGSTVIDLESARNFVSSLTNLRDELGIPGEVDLALLASFRESLKGGDPFLSPDELRRPLMGALNTALDTLGQMRQREGSSLKQDILGHLEEVRQLCDEIRERLPQAQAALSERYRERILKLAEGIDIEEGRLEQELIYASERGDISEELSRLDSHISQFHELMGNEGSLGRKLDFLIQEMNREANTIASKSIDLTLTQKSVDLKSALEKIREQVQNVE
ncbi:MAG: YicC/YloC family endoribonuclease [bacterium]